MQFNRRAHPIMTLNRKREKFTCAILSRLFSVINIEVNFTIDLRLCIHSTSYVNMHDLEIDKCASHDFKKTIDPFVEEESFELVKYRVHCI